MYVKHQVLQVIEALIFEIICHVYYGLQDGNDKARHVYFVRIDVVADEVVCADKTSLARVRRQTHSRVIASEVELGNHGVKQRMVVFQSLRVPAKMRLKFQPGLKYFPFAELEVKKPLQRLNIILLLS